MDSIVDLFFCEVAKIETDMVVQGIFKRGVM